MSEIYLEHEEDRWGEKVPYVRWREVSVEKAKEIAQGSPAYVWHLPGEVLACYMVSEDCVVYVLSGQDGDIKKAYELSWSLIIKEASR